MTVAIASSSCLASSCKINHFGINPMRGGRPPRDSKRAGAIIVSRGIFAQEVESLLMFRVLVTIRVMNSAEVITTYSKRVNSVSGGENCNTIIIHPRWAIDEYAIIFRSWVWLRPASPPTKVEAIASVVNSSWFWWGICTSRIIGASFCHVDKISPAVRLIP